MMPIKRVIYTYQEVLNITAAAGIPSYANDKNSTDSWFKNVLDALDLKYRIYGLDSTITDVIIAAIIQNLMDVVYGRHASDYVVWHDVPVNSNDVLTLQDALEFFSKIINIINITAPKFIPIFQANKKYSADPVGPLKGKSSSISRFNDTPQDGGDFADDEHTSNITMLESDTEADSGSIVDRLDAAFKNFRSIILEWANDFEDEFFKEEQL